MRGRRNRGVRTSGFGARVAGWTLLALGALLLTWLGFAALRDPLTQSSVFWLATPIGALALVRLHRAPRPVVLSAFAAGVTLGNLQHHSGAGVALAYGVGAAVETGVVAAATLRLTGIGPRLEEPSGALLRQWRDAIGFAVACLLGVGAGAGVVAGLRVLAGDPMTALGLRGYVLGHLTGLLILAAPLLCMPRTRAGWSTLLKDARANVEWVAFLLVTVAIGVPLFWTSAAVSMPYLLLVPILLGAERLEPFRATMVLWLACGIATGATLDGRGPLVRSDDHWWRLLLLQGYLSTLCASVLLVCLLAGVRRNANALVRESQILFDLAFDRAPTGMYITSLDPARMGQVLYANAALCTLVQRRPEEVIGQHVSILMPEEDEATVRANLERMLAGTLEHLERDRTLRRSDGRLLPTRIAGNVVRPEQAAPYFVVQITDLRDRIEAERAMAEALTAEATAAAELRRIDEARKATAARLAHDLRSPLTVARAYQELMSTGAAGELNDDQAEMIEIALRNTDRVIDLVDDLVSTASLQLDRIDTSNRRSTSVRSVLMSALDTVAPMIGSRSQTLDRPHRHLDEHFVVDPLQLERALVNVLTNASRFTPEGGRISVSVDADEAGVAIAVSDTGIGVGAHQIDRLGEQFFRADTAAAKGVRGVGLGLAVTKAVLAKHGGRLHVTSTPGTGSTFTLWLPRRAHRGAGDRSDQLVA
jgi:PAS domain S-box-containing protein